MVDTGSDYQAAFDKFAAQEAEGYDMDPQTAGGASTVHVHVPDTPTVQAYRLEALKLACTFDPEAGEGEVMVRAKNFADFVLEGKVPEYKTDADKEDEADEAELAAHLKRRYGTQAYITPEDEADIIGGDPDEV